VKLAARLTWIAAVAAVELLLAPVLWPFWLLRRAHRRAHEKEE
jgi:hypothetical protein